MIVITTADKSVNENNFLFFDLSSSRNSHKHCLSIPTPRKLFHFLLLLLIPLIFFALPALALRLLPGRFLHHFLCPPLPLQPLIIRVCRPGFDFLHRQHPHRLSPYCRHSSPLSSNLSLSINLGHSLHLLSLSLRLCCDLHCQSSNYNISNISRWKSRRSS